MKLYVDNLLCMDLCCWPKGEATTLLGSEVSSSIVNVVNRLCLVVVKVCLCLVIL